MGADRKKGNDEPARKKKRMEYDRYRSVAENLDFGDMATILSGQDMDQFITANLGYRARPLDGIWATPPYLHNSSVPSLYQMLVPAARRDPNFYLGSTRFDPRHVGYETRQIPGAFLMDTTQLGNHNTGHEFRNLTLEELEIKQAQPQDFSLSVERRWARVLDVAPEVYRMISAAKRWELTRDATRSALAKPTGLPITGVYGPEFSDEERWQLVEYLKTL
jgi:hypothetical protein